MQLEELQSELVTERGRASNSGRTLEESRARIEMLLSKIADLETNNLALNQRISDLAQKLEDEKFSHHAHVTCCSLQECY